MTPHTALPHPCIIINRMFTGEYVKHYLGHEIINLNRADNGKFYLYLNSEGNLVDKCCENGIMLMAKPVGNYTIEIFAIAFNLKIVGGVLSKQIRNDLNCPNNQQSNYIRNENITYNGVDIISIFSQNPPQSVYVTFETNNVIFAKLGNKIFIQFDGATPGSHGSGHYTRLTGIRYPNSSLRNFICPGNDKNQNYDVLMNQIINNPSLWDCSHQNNPPLVSPKMQDEFESRIKRS